MQNPQSDQHLRARGNCTRGGGGSARGRLVPLHYLRQRKAAAPDFNPKCYQCKGEPRTNLTGRSRKVCKLACIHT